VVSETSACLDEQMLADFVSGGLDAGLLGEVEAHLVQCPDCRHVVADAMHGARDFELSQAQHPEAEWPKPGDILAEKYRIEAPLGRGGMGVVLGAQHIELGHRVAIKVLDSKDPAAAARFLREAKTCAQLVNDHIVRVFDLGRLPDGVPYFVMEHLRGRDLGFRIARERLPVTLAVQYLLQVCEALKEAHAMGVIHRDLKPSNLFVVDRSDGQPLLKVLDFGISKLVTTQLGPSPQPTLTLPDAVLGSPLYMSPEQIRGIKGLDARTDIWSLGVIAYELLTRHRPFQAPTLAAALVAIATEEPARPSALVPDLPAGLEAVVLRCLAKDPSARFPNIEAVIAALSPFSRSGVSAANPPTPRRAPSRALVLSFAALVLLGATGWAFWQRSVSQRAVASSGPTTAALQPAARWQLAVHCDLPLPPGNVRWVPEAGSTALGWSGPVERLCEAEASAERRAELLAAFGDATAPTEMGLEPRHPFYSVALQRVQDHLSVQLHRAARARIPLDLKGADCRAIDNVLVRKAGAGGRLLGAAAAPISDANPCERVVELPFEDYGKRIGFQLEPAGYSASDADFQGERVSVNVQALATPPAKMQAGKSPRHNPAVSDCLPPKEFCRK
jgi:serine/threonine protein kinase